MYVSICNTRVIFLGSLCDNTIRSHFAKFNHFDLAMVRDNSNISSLSEEDKLSQKELAPVSPIVSQTQAPKFKFKKTAAKVVSSDTDINSNDKDSSDSFKSAKESVTKSKDSNEEMVIRLLEFDNRFLTASRTLAVHGILLMS